MPTEIFSDSATYRELNSYTHRLRHPDISAPALTWHTTYWIENQYTEQIHEETPRDYLKSELDKIIAKTLQALSLSQSNVSSLLAIPAVENKIVLFDSLIDINNYCLSSASPISKRQYDILNSDNRAVTFTFYLNDIHYRFRFELHTEYFCVTIIANSFDLQNCRNKKLKNALSLVRYMIGSGGKIECNLELLLSDFVYEEFWKQLFLELEQDCGVSETYHNDIFRTIFGDFRGLILSEAHVAALRRPLRVGSECREWGKNVADGLLSFVSHQKNYEATASYVLDGRGLYITSLGPQIGKNYEYKRSPVTFVVCARQYDRQNNIQDVNHVELGRLVYTLHTLGTVRVAALRDLKKLRRSGSLLAKFEPLTRSAQDRFRDIVAGRNVNDDLQSVMNNVYNEFNRIGVEFVRNTRVAGDRIKVSNELKYLTPGGLQYRIERSRYYVSDFDRNLILLCISKIEGFQTYEEFVQRRLRTVYDFIDRLGDRFERALVALSAIEQNYMALRADKTEGDLKQIAEEVRKIQNYGEVILLAVLVPYYLIATFYYVGRASTHAKAAYIITSALFITGAAVRSAPWVRNSRPLIVWQPRERASRLRLYAVHRRAIIRRLLALPLFNIRYARSSLKCFLRSKILGRTAIFFDRLRITLGDNLYEISQFITVRAVGVFAAVAAVWYLIVLPTIAPG